ncbi:MAG: Hcp family type VI secretion system effector [Planctomycetota bacterium]
MVVIDFGGKIKGDCKVTGHEDWISLTSVQLGVGRSIASSGGGADRTPSEPSFSELTVSKATDIASTELFAQSIYGKSLDKAEVHFLQTAGENAGQIYMSLELHEPVISSYSTSSSGDRPAETFSVSFVKIVMKYWQFTEGEKAKPADPKGFDLTAGVPFNG